MAVHKFPLIFMFFILTPGICDALPENPFRSIPVVFVGELPAGSVNRIAVISSRNIKPGEDFKIHHGLQSRLKMFSFVAGFMGDSVYAKPCRELAGAVMGMPHNRDFLVYVDGHGRTFDQVLERGLMLSKRFNLNLVIFDWPTDNLALRQTKNNADEVTVNFVKAMVELDQLHRQFFRDVAVSAIFHSMGNHILKNIIEQRLQRYLPQKLFSNIIVNAAAVRQFNHARWVEKLRIQTRIYITINDEDRTLRGAMLLRMAKQLGTGYRGRPANNALYINFSEIATVEHNLFLGRSQTEKDNRQIFRFYNEAFQGIQVNLTRESGFRKMENNPVYFATPESIRGDGVTGY